jgi:hypothetical protein
MATTTTHARSLLSLCLAIAIGCLNWVHGQAIVTGREGLIDTQLILFSKNVEPNDGPLIFQKKKKF